MRLGKFFRGGGRGGGDAQEGSSRAGEGSHEPAGARADDLSHSLGRARPEEQRVAAVERLTELRAAGKVSEENYVKEKRRLMREG